MYTDLNHYFLGSSRHIHRLFTDFLFNDCWADGDVKAKLTRQKRVIDKNLQLHGVPDRINELTFPKYD